MPAPSALARLLAIAVPALLSASLATGCGDDSSAAAPDAGPSTDAPTSPDAPPALQMCAAPLAAACADPAAAPTDPTAVAGFVRGEAIPLHCAGEGGTPRWDLSALLELFGDKKVFMLGEVHGTNEIGVVSGRVFEELATRGLVNVVAMELPMDFEAGFQRWLDTGHDDVAELLLDGFAPNFFGSVLPGKARELTLAGHPMPIGCIDAPYGTDVPVAAIRTLAEALTTQEGTVLDTLPAPLPFTDQPSAEYIAAAQAYDAHIRAERSAICAELDEAGCDRLDAMTTAIWVAVSLWDNTTDMDEWFARREQVIYYNLRQKVGAAEARLYLHMGAFHTNKYAESAGSRLAREFPATVDRVFSLAASYGGDSVIWYGQEVALDPYPAVVDEPLLEAVSDPYFVSTSRPSAACVANPLADQPEEIAGGTMSETYDGYLHIRKLTPETRPEDAQLEKRLVSPAARFQLRRERILEVERAVASRRRPVL